MGEGNGRRRKEGGIPNKRNKRMVSVTGLLPGGQIDVKRAATRRVREGMTTGPLRRFRSRPMIQFPH